MARLRILRTDWPRPGLYLTDTPEPACRICLGEGWIEHPYGDEYGEYAGSDWEPCICWNEHRRRLLLPLPRPKLPANYSDEPPF
ncbi:hypothetical protein AB0950_17250 [Streptomyces sp. NPDC007189]|uniref:hypothetical protein n=1 Tax=Streptomyces sp. NPDC007189 TaxID=3154315 RepID=UPI003455C01C